MIDWDEMFADIACLGCINFPYKSDPNYKPATWKTFARLIIFFVAIILVMALFAIIINF
jgi:hypothetical protein